MLRNYFIVTIRSLQKNGIYSFINIAGLTIGLACSILILLWVNDELSFDDFHEKKNRLYKVYVNGLGDGDKIYSQVAVPLPLWDALKTTESEIKNVAPTNWGGEYLLAYGEKRLYKQGYAAGDDFLKMFSFPMISGKAEGQLKDPSTIVLTESAARSLFDDEDPIGKVVRLDDEVDLTVTGIVKDVPSNSSLKFECLVPFTTYMNMEPWVKRSLENWGNNSFNMYVEFAEGADPAAIENRVKGLIKKNEKEETTHEVTFLPMERWRLYSEFENGKSTTGQIVYVRMFTTIAIFILFIACINFMNLATARSERRAREVGIRKSIGSRRKELIIQFLGETFFIALIAFILALGLVEGSLPIYNGLVNKNLSIEYTNPLFWISAIAVITATGFIAGSYPAFYLSSFQPAAVLKGKMQVGKKGSIPRKIMVVVQFFFSILLIIATLVVYQQMNHLKNRPIGYDRENLMLVSNTGDISKNYKAIKQELLDNGLASSVCTSNSPITSIYAFMGGVEWSGKREDQRASIATIGTGYDYTKTLGIKIKQGRDFSEEFNDSLSMLLNETAVSYMGLKNPLEETIRWDDKDYRIVGVFEDVVMASPNRSIDPTMVVFDPSWISDVTIRVAKGNSTQNGVEKMESIFKKYNPAYPFSYRFADDEFSKKFSTIEFIGSLVNVFSVLAILISCLGLFGLAAFTAEQRTKEIGIRKVMGATVSGVVVLLSKEFALLVVIAFALAAPLTWYVLDTYWLAQYAYRIDIQWWILGASGGLALVLAIVVVSMQAIKAAVANPVNSLRNE